MKKDWPPEWNAEYARVALVLNDIVSAGFADRQRLLAAFLEVAWPSARGRRQ